MHLNVLRGGIYHSHKPGKKGMEMGCSMQMTKFMVKIQIIMRIPNVIAVFFKVLLKNSANKLKSYRSKVFIKNSRNCAVEILKKVNFYIRCQQIFR